MENVLSLTTSKAYDQEKDKIRDMIGIQLPFQYPYFLFFSVDDLTNDEEDYIYFVGYEMKASGPAFWGYVDKENNDITINGSCQYHTNILNDMVKQWKANNLKYVAGSIKNKQYPRIQYDLDNLDDIYKMNYSDFEDQKYMVSYYRGEIDMKDLPKDLDKNKIKKFLNKMELLETDPSEVIEFIKRIDGMNHYLEIPNDSQKNKMFRVPRIITTPDYERYKALYALFSNKITQNQFNKLYPWIYTLNVMNSLLYDFFGYKEEFGETQYFWDIYKDEMDAFLGELYNQLVEYETKMNRIDTTYKTMMKIVNTFFDQIQKRKIKIHPTNKCPAIYDCMKMSGEIDTSNKECKVYYYPDGYKRGKLK